MSNIFKIGLYGDSLAMPRPGEVLREQRYLHLLKDHLKATAQQELEVIEKAKASMPIAELDTWVFHDKVYYPEAGRIFILHCGIVDCAPRPVNAERRESIDRLPSFIKKPVIRYLHNNRARLLNKHGGYFVTPIGDFKTHYANILKNASEQYDRLFAINICPTLDKTEAHSPGLSRSIARYNEAISEAVAQNKGKKVQLVDIHSAIASSSETEKYILSDGHHITPLAHRKIADLIIAGLS